LHNNKSPICKHEIKQRELLISNIFDK
jgi:hypothetical protein